jgi:hypothetical protein
MSAQQVIPANSAAALRYRIKNLPAHAQEKMKYLDRLHIEGVGRNHARAELRKSLVAERDRIKEEVEHLEIFSDKGGKLTPTEKATLAELEKELAAANAAIADAAKTKPLPSSDHRRKLAVLARHGGDLNTWLLEMPAARRFKLCRPELKLRQNQTLDEALTINREGQLDFAEQILIAQKAPLDVETALQKMRADVGRLAAKGEPDVSGVLRQRVTNARAGAEQGSVIFPTESIASIVATSRHDVQLGNSFLAWMFRPQLEQRLETLIRARIDPEASMSREERAARVRECEATILELQRAEELLVCKLEAQGNIAARVGGRNPLAILELEPA